MSEPILLTPVEQALVSEVAAWVDRSSAEIKLIADQKLAVILDAHGLLGQKCQFSKTETGWVLVKPDAAPVVLPADE